MRAGRKIKTHTASDDGSDDASLKTSGVMHGGDVDGAIGVGEPFRPSDAAQQCLLPSKLNRPAHGRTRRTVGADGL